MLARADLILAGVAAQGVRVQTHTAVQLNPLHLLRRQPNQQNPVQYQLHHRRHLRRVGKMKASRALMDEEVLAVDVVVAVEVGAHMIHHRREEKKK